MPDYAYMAYLDILGYRQMLESDVRAGTEEFREKMTRAFRVFEDVNASRFTYKAISDSIFICCNDRESVEELLELLRRLFRAFLGEGLFIRGGLSYGANFQSANVTYSPVLTKAYALESEVAEFPRIMIDENIPQMFPKIAEKQFILPTGKYWVLNIATPDTWCELWNAAKAACESSASIWKLSERVRAKHWWFQEYLRALGDIIGITLPCRYINIFD